MKKHQLSIIFSLVIVLLSTFCVSANPVLLEFRDRGEQALTRAEAAELLVKAFNLPLIFPLHLETDIEKQFEYTNSLGVIDESFVVPSASDTVRHKAEPYVEGILKVRAMGVEDGLFYPDMPITGPDFAEALGRVVFGVDGEVSAQKALSSLGIPNEKLSPDYISRADAVEVVKYIISDPAFTTITLLVTSDIHGHVVPYNPSGSEYSIGGMAKMAEFVKDTRNRQANTLLLDIGDAPYNTNVANLFEGLPVIETMNYMGYDAMVLGNHDFDFPFSVLKRNAGIASFPFLSANTYHNEAYPDFLKQWTIEEVDGIKVAIVGVTDHSSAWYTHPRNVEGITFENHFDAARRVVQSVQGQVDLVVALAHLHGDNRRLSENVTGIDFVLGGGTDIVAFPEKIADSWLIFPGKHSEVVNQLNINLWNKEIIGFNFAHVFMSENLPGDTYVTHLIDGYMAQLDDRLGEVIGHTSVDLDGERGTARLKESNLGNLIADSLRSVADADIALQNGGGIRASIAKGPISVNDIYTSLPFDNVVVVVETTGQTLWETLEHGVSWYPSAAGGFLQVSGVEYTFDAAQDVGSRIQSVTIDGQPIDLNKTYKVVTNDFLTGGGDMFVMLRDDAKVVLKTKFFLREAFTDYVKSMESVAAEAEGRITIINPASN